MIALAFIWSLFAQDKVGGWRGGGGLLFKYFDYV